MEEREVALRESKKALFRRTIDTATCQKLQILLFFHPQ